MSHLCVVSLEGRLPYTHLIVSQNTRHCSMPTRCPKLPCRFHTEISVNYDLERDTDLLVQQAASGDPEAADTLLKKHRQRLRNMVAVRMDPRLAARVDPSDVVQEALVIAHAKLAGYLQQRPIAFYPWLRQIAWQQLVGAHRKHLLAKQRDVRREKVWDPTLSNESAMLLANRLKTSISSPSQQMMRREMQRHVRDAMARLSEMDREILILRHVEDLTVKEVAAVLGIAEGTVKSRHFRALERLRSQIDE